jgi:hypothetical protein
VSARLRSLPPLFHQNQPTSLCEVNLHPHFSLPADDLYQLTPPPPEYIALLTRHVAKGRRENALSAAYRHLDRSAYWRAECERAKTDCRAAEEAKLDALREVDLLKSKLEFAKTAAIAGSKRKRQDGDVVPYSREVKKGRKDAEEKREVFLGGLVIEEVDAGEGDGGGEFFFCPLVAGGRDRGHLLTVCSPGSHAQVVPDRPVLQAGLASPCE